MIRLTRAFAVLLAFAISSPVVAQTERFDIVVYGGTSGGVVAAVHAARSGKHVALIEPGRHLGGLTSGGLGATDIGSKAAIGGISREFYRRVNHYYERPEAWTWQQREQYRASRSSDRLDEDAMWTFEPHVAEAIMDQLVDEAGVVVYRQERLDRAEGVAKEGTRIEAVRMESGRQFLAAIFLDATYEGDLLAGAGVSYVVGREGNDRYGETLNGVQTKQATKHQLQPGIDPYIIKGDPSSGLLPGIDASGPGQEGSQDHRVQAYNLRMCNSTHPENRLPFEKPEGYDPLDYELLLRNFEAGERRVPWNPVAMPNHKTDTNNNHGFSTDFIGQNYEWPEGDYATRERIYQDHLRYQQGLMWTLANHPRVPEAIRREISRWGNSRDEFVDNGGWPHQLYVREARRMLSDYVMTQHNCQGRAVVEDAIGLAAYTMDSHNVQRYVDADGHVRNEGDVQVGGFPPYPISYGSIVPSPDECTNLLVPVCLSASHIAYGSIRMEPVFMVLGQSASTAAIIAIDEGCAVQEVDIDRLQQQLLAAGQVLEWKGQATSAGRGIPVGEFDGIVVDDVQADFDGQWVHSQSVGPFIGSGYRHDDNEHKGGKSVRFAVDLERPGMYEVRFAFPPHVNRASQVHIQVVHVDGRDAVAVNQQQAPPGSSPFGRVGTYRFNRSAEVLIDTAGTDGYVVVDAIQLLPLNR